MPPPIRERLLDVGALRLAEMDGAGIDVQVLSHGAPATQKLDPGSAAEIARGVNDRLAGDNRRRPRPLPGLRGAAHPRPGGAADELDRCVGELGFRGAMVHGLTHGAFLDEQRFWPIFERAAALGVPVYMHPLVRTRDVIAAYYADYIGEFPGLLTAGWGFTVETATQGIRLVLSGVFDACPDLKIVLGHLGEGLPFLLWRIDQALSRTESRLASFRETFREHFYITTSGNFSDPGAVVQRDGDGHRPHPVLGRLPVRCQQGRNGLDGAASRSPPRTAARSCTATPSACWVCERGGDDTTGAQHGTPTRHFDRSRASARRPPLVISTGAVRQHGGSPLVISTGAVRSTAARFVISTGAVRSTAEWRNLVPMGQGRFLHCALRAPVEMTSGAGAGSRSGG